jgi:tRNA modification GTPase
MADADLILLVLDISRALNDQEKQLIASAPAEKTILIWNKSDLTPFPQPAVEAAAVAFTSAKEGTGIEELCHLIEKVIWKKGPPSKEEVTLTSQRHKQALEEAISATERLITGLKSDISPEFLSSDMRQILVELGTIIGTNVTEDILSAIFSKFCIGK